MILIVDDDVEMAENCSMFLEAEGFEVCVAASGGDALDQMKGIRPNLLISDFSMPGMTGAELRAELRLDPRMAGMPVLLMSGSMRCDVDGGDRCDGFLRKPFLAESLLAEVRKLLAAPRSTVAACGV
jgi:CheY-like chemotaxis protein